MKKRLYFTVFVMAAAIMSGCGKQETSPVPKDNTEKVSSDVQSEAKDEPIIAESAKEDALLGVYFGAEDIVTVPMGAVFDGENKIVCDVKIPSNYFVTAAYDTGDGYYLNFDNADNVEVRKACENGIWDGKDIMARCMTYIDSAEESTRIVIDITNTKVEDAPGYAKCEKAENCIYDTYYFSPEGGMGACDVKVYIVLADNILAKVDYTGPLFKTLGHEILVQNIQQLFTMR